MRGLIVAGGKLYAQCPDCGKLVRVNKPILGSLHICLSPEELAEKQKAKQ
jgi:hypothetical protein